MPLHPLKPLLHQALTQGFALPACRVVDLKTLDAALHAAERCQAPLVIQVSAAKAGPLGLRVLLAAIEAAANASPLPLVIMLDRAQSQAEAVEAIRLGCSAVLMAAAEAEVRASAAMARQCDITLGAVCHPGQDPSDWTVDFIALDQVGLLPADLPLALCDASGQDPAALRPQAALLGMGLAGTPAEIGDWIAGCGAAGKAEALRQSCPPMQPVEHLIIYNLSLEAESRAAEIMTQGRQVLSQIPGVRQVLTGTAIQQQAQFRFCWLVRFTGPSVIASYRDHPLHVEYADTWFRPFAADRISIDYQL